MEWKYFKSSAEAVSHLKKNSYLIYAIEQAEESIFLNDFIPPKDKKMALVFGNEVKGVENEVMELIDACIEIPQLGTKHSLNISVSIGVVLWDIFVKLKG